MSGPSPTFRSSAVAGGIIFVIGMVGRDASGDIVEGLSAQTVLTLQRIENELRVHGRDRSAIVRMRFYLVDMGEWPVARAVVGEFFGGSIPPSTALGVTALADPRMLIEIDVEASVT